MKKLPAILLVYLFPMFLLMIPFLLPVETPARPTGLVSYWQFDDGSGTTATDSLEINDGTIDGASWDVGLVDGALRFHGIDDIVRLPLISGYGDFTMSAWFKASPTDISRAIFQTGMGYLALRELADDYADFTYIIHLDREGGGPVHTQQNDYLKELVGIEFADEWHFIVMTATADDSELKAYLDGDFVGNLIWTFTGWNSVLNYANIGAMKASLWPGNQEGAYFLGLIDEVALFDRALSAEEISLYYQTGLNGMNLFTIPTPATINIHPRTLKLSRRGNYVTCYIELPEGCQITDIIENSVAIIKCNGTSIDPPLYKVMHDYQDKDDDGVNETLMVKFDHEALVENLQPGNTCTITVFGDLTNGECFEGIDEIRTQ